MKKTMITLVAVLLITSVFMGYSKSKVTQINNKTVMFKTATLIEDVKKTKEGVRNIINAPLTDQYIQSNWEIKLLTN